MALRYHAGWEEISLAGGLLQVRHLTGFSGEPPVVFNPAWIRRLQVEYDTLRYGGDWYRVQIVGKDGQGLLPADGLLTGIRTYDEALALAFAITHHFDLTAVPGLHPSSNPSYYVAPQPDALMPAPCPRHPPTPPPPLNSPKQKMAQASPSAIARKMS